MSFIYCGDRLRHDFWLISRSENQRTPPRNQVPNEGKCPLWKIIIILSPLIVSFHEHTHTHTSPVILPANCAKELGNLIRMEWLQLPAHCRLPQQQSPVPPSGRWGWKMMARAESESQMMRRERERKRERERGKGVTHSLLVPHEVCCVHASLTFEFREGRKREDDGLGHTHTTRE